jgi:hypothetical protein
MIQLQVLMYRLVACLVNVVARFCVFLVVIVDGVCVLIQHRHC